MSRPPLKTLSEQSAESRADLRPVKVYGDGLKSAYADRERKQIFGLAFTAANLAAAERRRHGRDSTPDEKSDAAQDCLAAIYGATAEPIRAICEVHLVADRIPAAYWQEGNHVSGPCYRCRDCAFSGETDAEMRPIPTAAAPPKLADLIDADRQTVSSFDGSRESLRPSPEVIALAGASLDAAHRDRALLDPEAGSTGLVAASAASRKAGEARRSVAPQLLDPAVSPIPSPVEDAMRQAGIWPDDPIRQAVCDWIAPDLTAADWSAAGEKGTPEAIATRRKRGGRLVLDADPKARTFADYLRPSLEPTPAEIREAESVGAARLLEINPHGVKVKAASLRDPAWRMAQPFTNPLKVSSPDADTSI